MYVLPHPLLSGPVTAALKRFLKILTGDFVGFTTGIHQVKWCSALVHRLHESVMPFAYSQKLLEPKPMKAG